MLNGLFRTPAYLTHFLFPLQLRNNGPSSTVLGTTDLFTCTGTFDLLHCTLGIFSCLTLTADIGALDCDEKLMEHLPPEGKKVLVELLQPLSHGKDYRGLASRLGFDMQHIYYLQGLNEPVTVLLNAIKHKKISEVISILDDMGRKDAAEDLRHFEGETIFFGIDQN